MKQILTGLGVVGLLFWAGAASAQGFPVRDNPLEISRLQCRLLLHAAGDPRVLVGGLLDEITGEKSYTKRLEATELQALQRAGAAQPDMGFVLGRRWETATRSERRNFNYYFTRLLVQQRQIQPVKSYTHTCPISVTTTLLEDHALPDAHPGKRDFPRERSYQATAHSTLPDGTSISYRLVKYPNTPWHVLEMELGGTQLAATYAPRYNAILSKEGFSGLIKTLVATTASSGSDTPQ